MRIPRRILLAFQTAFHLIWKVHNSAFLLNSVKEKMLYLQTVLQDYSKRCGANQFIINGYCVMSNHCHINAVIVDSHQHLSDHLRRAHSRFAQSYNRRHKRSGAFFNGRPKTKPIEDEQHRIRAFFYSDMNPVRAGIVRHPTSIIYRNFSSCRYYAYGEKTEFSKMLTPPDWYMRLGDTPQKRQKKYRALLEHYMIEAGLKRDPMIANGRFIGSPEWIKTMRTRIRGMKNDITRDEAMSNKFIDTS